MKRILFIVILMLASLTHLSASQFTSSLPTIQTSVQESIVADHTVISEFDNIPDSIFEKIHDSFRINWVRTSHGQQPIAGMNAIWLDADDSNYILNLVWAGETLDHHLNIDTVQSDYGTVYDFWWMDTLRHRWLEIEGYDRNVATVTWCGGLEWQSEAGLDALFDSVEVFEAEYPDVTFVYQTGHLDGTGPTGHVWQMNDYIRQYCEDNNKVLFDFADIETYDPDGNYYPNGTDACEWCSTWCATHDCPPCVTIGCSHSHDFNCYQKGKAWWWLMAQLVERDESAELDWESIDLGFTTVYVQIVDRIDDSAMMANGYQRVGNLYIDKISRIGSATHWMGCDGVYALVPIEYDIVAVVYWPDLDGTGENDISDLILLIDHMFMSGE